MKNVRCFSLIATALAATALLIVSACSTAEVKDTWTAPDLSKISYKNVLVIAATKDGTARRTFEDAVIAAVPNANIHITPSYVFLAGKDVSDAAGISAALKTAGFDAVVTMRLISDRQELNVNSTGGYYGAYPMGYRSFGGYYGGYAMGGTTVTTDRILQIETNIYEFPSEKLVWSAVIESTSPGNLKQMATDAVAAIRQQMIKQQLIAAPAK
jgi:hypothetical protein